MSKTVIKILRQSTLIKNQQLFTCLNAACITSVYELWCALWMNFVMPGDLNLFTWNSTAS